MEIKDLSTQTYSPSLHEGVSTCSIGWLGSSIQGSPSKTSEEIIQILRHFANFHFVLDGELGKHQCEICRKKEFKGEFWIESNNVRYVLPLAIFHYIVEHNYSPPKEFNETLVDFWNSSESLKCRNGQCETENSNRTGLEWLDDSVGEKFETGPSLTTKLFKKIKNIFE